jgi:Outer membrane cytochrome MtrC/MtrF-like, domains II/IV
MLTVSDEMNCRTCHASGSNPAAMPAAGWENAADPAKDVKWNILRLHDEKQSVAAMLPALQAAGYPYQSSLYATAKAGTPILCDACHASNALGTAGVPPATQLTTAMHSLHGGVVNPATGLTLDNAATSAGSCYLCHPGATTRCQRGAMHGVECFDCHGNLSAVGASTRVGWLDVPACQMCHNSGQRYPTTFSSPGVWRTTSDTQFATNLNVPIQGKSLYRYSTGHGGVYCSACHGSQHAEYPTIQANDNVAPIALQGYSARLTECGVCHATVPTASNGGPHGLHTVGQAWVQAHQSYARSNLAACGTCHGSTYRGTVLSTIAVAKSFSVEGGTRSFLAGASVGCYDCHNGPNGG